MEKLQFLSRLSNIENPLKIPVAELCGQNRLLIENHMGVLSYGLTEIRIKVAYGSLQIVGNDLRLMELCREQLVIIGQIASVNIMEA